MRFVDNLFWDYNSPTDFLEFLDAVEFLFVILDSLIDIIVSKLCTIYFLDAVEFLLVILDGLIDTIVSKLCTIDFLDAVEFLLVILDS